MELHSNNKANPFYVYFVFWYEMTSHHHTHYQIVGGKYLSKVTLIIATSQGISMVLPKNTSCTNPNATSFIGSVELQQKPRLQVE